MHAIRGAGGNPFVPALWYLGAMAIGVGLLGCGTVGGGLVQLLGARAREIEARVGERIEIVDVAVRDLSKARVSALGAVRLTANPSEVVANPKVSIVVELMGGVTPARELLLDAIARKKPVVTANKMLLAHHGPEIFDRAREGSVDVAFEGAVGGGIPVVRVLRDALAGDRVRRIVGILNGTSNYVLTRMQREGLGFDEVVREAQRLGYAEEDPSLDIDGHDAAHKLVVLCALAFGKRIELERIATSGLRALEPIDHASAARLGYVVKPLAVAADTGQTHPSLGPILALRVGPALVPKEALLANVAGVLNAVLVEGEALGPCVLSGRGAGDEPTAVSVLGDLIDVARAARAKSSGLLTSAVRTEPASVQDAGEALAAFYLRFVVQDKPGVLGKITTTLGRAGVSIRELVQMRRADLGADVVMLTHESLSAHVTDALREIDTESFALQRTRVFPVLSV